MQVKLDEVILCLRGAQNRMIGIEHLTDKELEKLVEEAERRAAIPPTQRHATTGQRVKKTASTGARAKTAGAKRKAGAQGPATRK